MAIVGMTAGWPAPGGADTVVVGAAVLGAVLLGAFAGPWVRAVVFRHAVPGPGAQRRACPRCAAPVPWRLGVVAGVVSRGAHRAPPRVGSGFPGRLPASGRARCCGVRIGPAAGSVEVVGALLCAAVVLAPGRVPWPLGCWLALAGSALVAVDAAVHRLPFPLTAATTAGTGAALLAVGWADPEVAVRVVAAAVVAGVGLVVLRALTRGGVGGGDCALAPALGAALGLHGWAALLLGALAATLLGGLHAVVAVVVAATSRHRGEAAAIPFGPALVGGAMLVLTAPAVVG